MTNQACPYIQHTHTHLTHTHTQSHTHSHATGKLIVDLAKLQPACGHTPSHTCARTHSHAHIHPHTPTHTHTHTHTHTGKLIVDLSKLQPVARLGGTSYGSIGEVYQIARPNKDQAHTPVAGYN